MVFQVWFHHQERGREEKLARLEKRLVANVEFDDQALQVLGFQADIYHLLGNLG
jgi:hypothetical protein